MLHTRHIEYSTLMDIHMVWRVESGLLSMQYYWSAEMLPIYLYSHKSYSFVYFIIDIDTLKIVEHKKTKEYNIPSDEEHVRQSNEKKTCIKTERETHTHETRQDKTRQKKKITK